MDNSNILFSVFEQYEEYFWETIGIHDIMNIRLINKSSNSIFQKYVYIKEKPMLKNYSHAQYIVFGPQFNESIDDLDLKNVKGMQFGDAFNQRINNKTISELKILVFGDSFNQELDGIDLSNVSALILGYSFDKSLNDVYVPNLRHLTCGKRYNRYIVNSSIPQSCEIYKSQYNL